MLSEAQIHAEAGIIIGIAMGREKVKRGKAWRANEDPLAYVFGVEAIVSLVRRAALSATEIPGSDFARAALSGPPSAGTLGARTL